MNRFISTVLVAVMILSLLALGASAESYHEPDDGPPIFADVDVKDNAWYAEYVYSVFHKGIMEGTTSPDTWGTPYSTFEPNGTLTRAMLVTILTRFVKAQYGKTLTIPENYSESFSDVKEGKWYTDYAYIAKANGIVTGYPDGTFRPNRPVTREEAVVMISRVIFNTEITGDNVVYILDDAPAEPFKDADKVVTYAKRNTDILVRMGVLNGDQNGCFNPKAYITRAETAKIIAKLIDVRLLDESNMAEYAELSCDDGNPTWKAGTTQYLHVSVKYNTAFCYYGDTSSFYPVGWVECKSMMSYATGALSGITIIEKGSLKKYMTYEVYSDAEVGTYDLTIKIPFASKVIEDCVTIVK